MRSVGSGGFRHAGPLFAAIIAASLHFSAARPAECASSRTIRAGVAVSPQYKTNPEWKRVFLKRLAYASKIFEQEFGIKFKAVTFWDWPAETDRQDMNYLMEDLMSRYPLDGVDIVIGLTRYVPVRSLSPTKPPPPLGDLHVLGRTRAFSGYMVLRYPDTALYRVQEETILTHELGHLFGAIHTSAPETIMAPAVGRQIPTAFDNDNRKMIMLTRDVDFRKGFDELNRPTIQQFLISYKKLIHTDQTFEFYRDLGTFFLRESQPRDALDAWNAALRMEPRHARLVYDLGMLHYKMDNNEEALTHLVNAVALFRWPSEDRNKASALHVLGNIYFAKGDHTTAYRYWTQSDGIVGDSLSNKIHLCTARIMQGHFADAERDLKNMLAADESNAKALGNLGLLYFKQEDYPNAMTYLQKALASAGPQRKRGDLTALDIDEPSELNRYVSMIYKATGGAQGMLEHMERSVADNPSVDGYKLLGEAYCKTGDWDGCIKYLGGIKKHARDDAHLYALLGWAVYQKGARAQAVSILEEGLPHASRREDRATLHKRLGIIYRDDERWDDAIRSFQRALDAEWDDAETHYALAVTYLNKKRIDDGRRALKNVLLIDPTHPEAKEALERLEGH